MKGFFLLTLLSVIFVSNYAMAQRCPCDTVQLPDGTTGNDILELVCPGGQLSDAGGFDLNDNLVVVFLDGSDYAVVSASGICGITQDNIGNGVEGLSPEVTQDCRDSLIQRCNLLDREEAIPTLSEWGLIAMAGVLGLIGFIVIRRRKVTA